MKREGGPALDSVGERGRAGRKASQAWLRPRKSTTDRILVVPLDDAIDIAHVWIAGRHAAEAKRGTGRYRLALVARTVDLSREACTCGLAGRCEVCKYWHALSMRVGGPE